MVKQNNETPSMVHPQVILKYVDLIMNVYDSDHAPRGKLRTKADVLPNNITISKDR